MKYHIIVSYKIFMKRYNVSNLMHLFANEFSFFKKLAKLSVTGQKKTKDIFHFYFYTLEE